MKSTIKYILDKASKKGEYKFHMLDIICEDTGVILVTYKSKFEEDCLGFPVLIFKLELAKFHNSECVGYKITSIHSINYADEDDLQEILSNVKSSVKDYNRFIIME